MRQTDGRDGRNAGDNAGGSTGAGGDVVAREAQEECRKQLGHEAVAHQQQGDDCLPALECEIDGDQRHHRDQELGEPRDPRVVGSRREGPVDIVGEHGRCGQQDHRAGHQGGEHARCPDHADNPGVEGLERELEQSEVDVRAGKPADLEDRRKADEENEQQDELIERQDDRVLTDDLRAFRGVDRGERVRPHVEAERRQQYGRGKPPQALAMGRQCREPGLLLLDRSEHRTQAAVIMVGQIESEKHRDRENHRVLGDRGPRRAMHA